MCVHCNEVFYPLQLLVNSLPLGRADYTDTVFIYVDRKFPKDLYLWEISISTFNKTSYSYHQFNVNIHNIYKIIISTIIPTPIPITTTTPPRPPPPPGLHKCVRELGQHCFRQWFVAYSAPSHHLNKCRVVFKLTLRKKLQWNFNQNTKRFNHENASEDIVCDMAAILSRRRWSLMVRPKSSEDVHIMPLEVVTVCLLAGMCPALPP